MPSLFGPFEANRAYAAIVRSLCHAGLVFGLGLVLLILGRSRPQTAGVLALVLTTADLATANNRHILTVPQSLLESKSTALQIIHDAERARPTSGPFRVHRMPFWNPRGWLATESAGRVSEVALWERDTLQAKSGINSGVEYTRTIGVAELYDYEWYFTGFFWGIHDPELARRLGIRVGEQMIYCPRRAFDMWNTRYFIVPFNPAGWRDEMLALASFQYRSEPIYPGPEMFQGPSRPEAYKGWIETRDFKIYRNLQEFPRAWVVHRAREAKPMSSLSPDARGAAMQEILYANDPIWRDSTRHAEDPRRIAWVEANDLDAISSGLSGRLPLASEAVNVTYPSPQRVVLEATLDSPGLIVLADIHYPGWELQIDDQPAPILRVNVAMRGAAVAKGTHRLVYTYAPKSFKRGALITIAGLTALALLSAVCLWRPLDPVIIKSGAPVSAAPG
jgi:hypothetical protein